MLASVAGISVLGFANASPVQSDEKEVNNVTEYEDIPLFSGSTKLGNMIFVAGKGAHVEPFEIKAHTEIVLKEPEK
jgi:2-iminobutanoate/2-iminopropanoate deaminase